MTDTKMRDPVREQFETVFSEAFPLIFAAAKAGEAKAHGDMSVAWWGWQALRQAVVVELPAEWATNVGTMLPPPAVHKAIKAQGLRVGVRK